MPYSPEHLLQLLQQVNKHHTQLKQIQALAITHGHLHFNPRDFTTFRWMSTLLFNSLITSYLNNGLPFKSLILFTHMLDHRSPPNNFTFPSVIKGASSHLSFASKLGRPLHCQAFRRGLVPDPFVQTSLISFYAKFGGLGDARLVFDEMPEPCKVSCNSMLDAFVANGDISSAVSLFDSMSERDVYSWTSMINGLSQKGHYRMAIGFLRKMMMQSSVKPNEATFVSILSCCANSDEGGALYQGKEIHGYMIKNETELTVFMGTALISLYGKLGKICTWNAILSSLASNGGEKEALDLFDKMKEENIRPNEVTFVTLLSACSHARCVSLGLEMFQSMLQKWGIVPKMEHYGCVVDLLARAGLLNESKEFIKEMPFTPDETVLGALLGACKVHGAIELGNEVGKRLLDLQLMHCGRYVALSSMNALAERWGSAADYRRAMSKAGIRKIPAYSLIDPLFPYKEVQSISIGSTTQPNFVPPSSEDNEDLFVIANPKITDYSNNFHISPRSNRDLSPGQDVSKDSSLATIVVEEVPMIQQPISNSGREFRTKPMGRGERIGSKNNSEGRVRKKDVKSDDSDEDYMLEEDETDNLSDELDSLVGDASDEESLGSFLDKEEEEKVRNFVKPKSCKRSMSKRNNGNKSSRKRRRIDDEDDDADYEDEEEDDGADYSYGCGGGTSIGRFVNEVEEENERKLVWPKSHKRTTGRRKKGIGCIIKREMIANDEDDKDYDEDNDVDAGSIGGNCANLGGSVEEEEEEGVREVDRPSTGKRENGTTSSRERKRIDKDEDYYEEDNDVDAESIDGGDAVLHAADSGDGGSNHVDEEEESVRVVDKPETCNRSTGKRQNGTRRSRQRNRIVDDEDYYEEEDNDVVAESTDGGGGRRQNGTRSSRQRKRIVDDEDYNEEEDNDVVAEGIDGGVRKRQNGNRSSRQKKRTVDDEDYYEEEDNDVLKKPQKNKRQGSSRSSKPTSSRYRKSMKKVRSSSGKCKRRFIHRRKKTKPCSDSDFAISEPSDYEFTISEEEREQVREANEFCRRSSNPKSLKQDQQDAAGNQLKKIPRRKGKEKVEEVKSDVGKQVCGICLTEEGKNTIRGTLDCCSHFFCFPCIMEWSKVESRCPLCKQRFYTISKSTRSSTRIDLRNVVIHVPERDQVYQPSEEELRDYLDSYENVFCTECHEGGDDALMLLCDICNSPSHTYCVGLGREVPDGNWYCEGCRPSAIGSTTSQAQDLTPTQRSNNNFLTEPTFENMAEIDLNITVPETPMTPVNDFLVSPRQPSGVTLQAPSPLSSVGVSTLFGRRRVHRLQYLLSSNRLSPMDMRMGRSFSFDRNSFSGPWEDRAAQLSSLDTPTTEVGSSYNAEYVDRLHENPFSSAQNRESFNGRLSLMRGQPLSLQVPCVADSSAYGIYSELNKVPERLSLQPCTSRLNLDSEISTSSLLNQNVVEQQLHSLVKSHLINLCRDINLDLGQDAFKQITFSSTHTILAASGLAHSRIEVHEIQPPNCCHSEALVSPQTSLIKNCCQACFDAFVRYVVMTITMGFKPKPPEQLESRGGGDIFADYPAVDSTVQKLSSSTSYLYI
ncbi:hypothetical protein V2J09_019662 [Rumex salicifolius]